MRWQTRHEGFRTRRRMEDVFAKTTEGDDRLARYSYGAFKE